MIGTTKPARWPPTQRTLRKYTRRRHTGESYLQLIADRPAQGRTPAGRMTIEVHTGESFELAHKTLVRFLHA